MIKSATLNWNILYEKNNFIGLRPAGVAGNAAGASVVI
jgi:hypothetical protein